MADQYFFTSKALYTKSLLCVTLLKIFPLEPLALIMPTVRLQMQGRR